MERWKPNEVFYFICGDWVSWREVRHRLFVHGAAIMWGTIWNMEEVSGICIQICGWQWDEVQRCELSNAISFFVLLRSWGVTLQVPHAVESKNFEARCGL